MLDPRPDSSQRLTAASTDQAADSKKNAASACAQARTDMNAAILSSFESCVDNVFICEHTNGENGRKEIKKLIVNRMVSDEEMRN